MRRYFLHEVIKNQTLTVDRIIATKHESEARVSMFNHVLEAGSNSNVECDIIQADLLWSGGVDQWIGLEVIYGYSHDALMYILVEDSHYVTEVCGKHLIGVVQCLWRHHPNGNIRVYGNPKMIMHFEKAAKPTNKGELVYDKIYRTRRIENH